MGGEEEALFGGFLFGNALFGGGGAEASAAEVTPLIVPICLTGEWPTYSFAINLEC